MGWDGQLGRFLLGGGQCDVWKGVGVRYRLDKGLEVGNGVYEVGVKGVGGMEGEKFRGQRGWV